MIIGHIEEIVRHPVKSFYGESVEKTKVIDYGLYGDRSHAFIDRNRPGRFLTITQFPEMAKYTAGFLGEEQMDEYPAVEITTPEGNLLTWEDNGLIEELEKKSKRNISQLKYSPTYVPLGAIEQEHIQLVTDASVDEMKKIWGKELDYRRFRPNLFISLIDKIPFIEEQWFGKRIKVGDHVELELIRHCERCMIITIDPLTGERDPSLLESVVKERRNHFGVYASVIKTGEIKLGDHVFLQ